MSAHNAGADHGRATAVRSALLLASGVVESVAVDLATAGSTPDADACATAGERAAAAKAIVRRSAPEPAAWHGLLPAEG